LTLTKKQVFNFATQQSTLMHYSLQTASEPTPTIIPATATTFPITVIDDLLCYLFTEISAFSRGLLFITFFYKKANHQI